MVLYRFTNTQKESTIKTEHKQSTKYSDYQDAQEQVFSDTDKEEEIETSFSFDIIHTILYVMLVVLTLVFVLFFVLSLWSLFQSNPDEQDSTIETQITIVDKQQDESIDVANYGVFEGKQENGYPAKWDATVNKDKPNLDFQQLIEMVNYKLRIAGGKGWVSADIYQGDECIASNITSSWPAYTCCNDSQTKTYDLTVHVRNEYIFSVCTIPLTLTVEQ